MYDLAIIGGGPAGVAAGVYASRKRLKTVFITKDFEGQSSVSEGVENWIGTVRIPGAELSKNLENHLRAYAGDIVDIKTGGLCEKISKVDGGFLVKTNNGEYRAKTILVTTGSYRRKLEAPGADTFEHKGLTYCATCDGPIFAGQDVAVVGGGNAAFETAAQLLAYCQSVTLLNRGSEFRADPVTVEKLQKNAKFKIIKNAVVAEVKGDKFVTGLVYKDAASGQTTELPVTGIFVEIGLLPNTAFVKEVAKLNDYNQIVVNPRNQRAYLQTPETAPDVRRGESDAGGVGTATVTATQGLRNDADETVSGVWAAGDCSDGLYHQNNIAAGDAVKALEDIFAYLHTK